MAVGHVETGPKSIASVQRGAGRLVRAQVDPWQRMPLAARLSASSDLLRPSSPCRALSAAERLTARTLRTLVLHRKARQELHPEGRRQVVLFAGAAPGGPAGQGRKTADGRALIKLCTLWRSPGSR